MKKTKNTFIYKENQTNFKFFNQQNGIVKATPFIKWAGGKSSILGELRRRLPPKYKNYFEPFAGGAALFFAINPKKAYICDQNEELINTYSIVKAQPKKLISKLKEFKYESEAFYRVRDLDRDKKYKKLSKVSKAARFIYLNKTCFNGLYRVNSKGEFNVPFGKYKDPKIADSENILACSRALSKAKLLNIPFDKILSKVKKGDFVYLDPPYMPVSQTANFTSYTKEGFGIKEQKKLAEFCRKLHKKGAYFLLSNSSHPEIIKMFKGFTVETIKAPRAINSKAEKRGVVSEILVRNYL